MASLLDIKHQPYAQRMIQRAIASHRTPHAYIFHGPDGVGKELFARRLAQLLLCPSPIERAVAEGETSAIGMDKLQVGCGTCDDCRILAAESHPDWHLIYRQLNRDHPDPEVRKRKGIDIGVDVLRHFVIDKVGLKPARGRAKVFAIREADRITPAAQNALLKTLEEPPGTTFILLLVASLDRLLPTTLSRCQQIRFDPLPVSFVRQRLAEPLPDIDEQQCDWLARFSEGTIGPALLAAEDGLYELNQRLVSGLSTDPAMDPDSLIKAWTKEAESLGESYAKRDPDITKTEATRSGLKSVFKLAAAWYADVLRTASGSADAVLNVEHKSTLARAAKRMDVDRCSESIARLARAEWHLDRNAFPPLCVETLLNELEEIATGRSPVTT